MSVPSRSNSHVTCIIPFYNEGRRILRVLDAITRSHAISQIICVDDGSADNTYRQIQEDYPSIEVIRSDRNQGKSRAIVQGWHAHAKKTSFCLTLTSMQSTSINSTLQSLRFHSLRGLT